MPASAPQTNERRPLFWGRQAGFFVRGLLALLQFVALALSVELSGAVHVALDVATLEAGDEHPDEDCDEHDHECPPGCPNCHASHSVIASSALHIEVALTVVQPAPAAVGFVPSEQTPPRGPERARLDRPPKYTARS